MKLFSTLKLLTAITAAFVLNSCITSNSVPVADTSLKDWYKDYFFIGAVLNTTQIEGKDSVTAVLVPQQFSSIKPENIMKAEVVHRMGQE